MWQEVIRWYNKIPVNYIPKITLTIALVFRKWLNLNIKGQQEYHVILLNKLIQYKIKWTMPYWLFNFYLIKKDSYQGLYYNQ